MLLREMTWEEIDRLDRSTVVVAPFGAVEQHSLHLPLETDALIAQELSRRLDSACDGQLLVLPTQWLGLSIHHMGFSGTLTASALTFIGMVNEILDSIAKAGFRKILILNSHGGNAAVLEVVLGEFQSKHSGVRAVLVSYWNVATEKLQQLRESPLGGMGHACELETSLILAINPGLVRLTKLAPDGMVSRSRFLYQDMLVPGSVSIWWNPSETSKHGGDGDPRSASPEKGERFFSAIVARLVQVVDELRSGGFENPARSLGER